MQARCQHRNRAQEGGFALLVVLFLAATVAFVTLVAIPQAAVQAQRVREQKLIYEGQQYQRAIELYFRKNKKYPQEFEDLENTNGIRFLRRKYKDPMTGEDEWRVIHMGPDGKFTDSLLYDLPPPEGEGQATGAGGYQMTGGYGIQASAPIGSVAAGGYGGSGTAINAFRGGDRARAIRGSAAPDLPASGGPDPFFNPDANQAANGQGDPNNPNAPADPNAPPGQNQNGQQGQDRTYAGVLPSQVPQALGQRAGPNGIPGQPGYPLPGQPGYPQAGQPGYPQQPGGYGQLPVQGAYPQQAGIGGNSQQNQPGNPPAAFGAAGVGSDASSMIRGLLTTPRPGGLAGLGGQTGQQQQAGAPGFTGGIAGVATKLEDQGVLVYQGQDFYNLWEFVYDYRQDAAGGGGGAGGPAAGQALPAGQPGLGPGGGFAPAGVVQPGGQPGAYPPGYPTSGPGNPYGQPGLPSTAPRLPGMGGNPNTNQRGRRPNPNQTGGTQNPDDQNLPPIPGTPAYYEWLRQQQQQNQQQNRRPGVPQGRPGANPQNPNQPQRPGVLPFPNQPQPPNTQQNQ